MAETQTTLGASGIVSMVALPSTPPENRAIKPLWQIFDEVATEHSERIAISCGTEQLSYRELQARASRLACQLRSLGVGPDTLVGVYLERSARAIAALVAIVKAGGAYLPLDPAYPGERIGMILEDAQPKVLITEQQLVSRLPVHDARVLLLGDEDHSESESMSWDHAIDSRSTAQDLAYVIYTSGSTGKPKGVMVTHANVSRLLGATVDWFHFDENDVWTLFHSLAFDFSVWEVWGCLLHGGRLVIVPFAVSRSPEDFHELLVREQVTVLNQTPSAFYQLIAADQSKRTERLALRLVIFGGEALNFRALIPWFAAHTSRLPRLINMYGITETTVHVTYREVDADDATHGAGSLIGVPIPDMQLYLLDQDGRPVQTGETGEIYVGGAGVARGYLNRPELNAERFIVDPFSEVHGSRLYKSGDLARRRVDGDIEYLGRGDTQVKIHGFRIELGEIEAAITTHGRIREARVLAHVDEAGTKRLVAYYVAHPGEKVQASEISRFLSAKLPPWMMPAVYLPIPVFPLTPHGKVDFAALPAPVFGSAKPVEGALGTELEERVAGVWRGALGADYIGLDDNFFDIGGTSLLLMSVHTKLQELFNRKIAIADLFTYTTIRTLAGKLGGAVSDLRSWQAAQSKAEKQRAAFASARAGKRAVL